MLVYILGVHSWYKLAHLWPSWDFSPHQIRKQAEQCAGGRAGNHWLCLHRRNRKCPHSVTCWNERSSHISLLCTPGEINPILSTGCAVRVLPQARAVSATTTPGLLWLLRAENKPWPAVCSHCTGLSSPALPSGSYSLWSCVVTFIITVSLRPAQS